MLLIEAGDYFNALTQIPTAATLLQGSKHDWSLKTEPQMYSSFGMLNHVIKLLPLKFASISLKLYYLLILGTSIPSRKRIRGLRSIKLFGSYGTDSKRL